VAPKPNQLPTTDVMTNHSVLFI